MDSRAPGARRFARVRHGRPDHLPHQCRQGSRLALVTVSPDGPDRDQVRYITDPLRDVDFGDFNATGLGGNWHKEWTRGSEPS